MKRILHSKTTHIVLLSIGGLIAIYWYANQQKLNLEDSSFLTGYASLTIMVLLALFNIRKKLSMIPAIQARTWLRIHVVFGFGMIFLFWLHTESVWPSGLYEQIIAVLFYLVCLSGMVGYLLSRTLPSRLRHIGNEIIYERIPTELYNTREAAKLEISTAVNINGNEVLAREYEESLAWFFAQPRFFFSHIVGSGRPAAWVQNKATSLSPFLSEEESEKFAPLLGLMKYKNQIDAHYANQKLLKHWLFFHLPLTVSLLVFVGWHVLLVHLYAL